MEALVFLDEATLKNVAGVAGFFTRQAQLSEQAARAASYEYVKGGCVDNDQLQTAKDNHARSTMYGSLRQQLLSDPALPAGYSPNQAAAQTGLQQAAAANADTAIVPAKNAA
jgi:hypothetical protein